MKDNENEPMISVIMGIYNCAKTLPEAVESILNQTYTNWELIMCDDGSNDDTYSNKEMVSVRELTNKYDVLELKDMIKEHVAYTNSEKGKKILENFGEYLPKFKKIIPHDYERMLNAIVQMEEKGLSSEQAQIEAFYANARG